MNGLITPRRGPGICPFCFNFMLEKEGRCRACRASESHLDALAPISYAEAGSPLHRALADYKRAAEPSVPDLVANLAELLSTFLAAHESCIAAAAGVDRFDAVTVVPSSRRSRDVTHPLRETLIPGIPEVRERLTRGLVPTEIESVPHQFNARRFRAVRAFTGERVLLIDDVWTTGANGQSAATVLKDAGASSVAAVVIGRYVNGHWGGIHERLGSMRSDDRLRNECCFCSGMDRQEGGFVEPDLDRQDSDPRRFIYSGLPERGA